MERLILGLSKPHRQHLRVGLHENPGAGCHQTGHPIGCRVGRLAAGMLHRGIDPDARLHIGHALGGQRMAAQIGKSAAIGKPAGLLQDRKHVHKALRRKPRIAQHGETNAVGLAFHIARIVELALHRQRLAAHNGRVRPLRVVSALAGSQHAQYQSAQNPGCHAALAGHVAGNMALGHMAEFVRQNRSQLGAALGCRDQPQVKAHITAGQSKRVHRAITGQQDHPGIQVFFRW